MKSIHIFLGTLILLFSVPAHAQWAKKIKGNGNVVKENRAVSTYEEISIDGNIDVVLIDGV